MSGLAMSHGLVLRGTALAAALTLFGVSLAAVFGQTSGSYLPGPAPTVGPIQWECVQRPQSR